MKLAYADKLTPEAHQSQVIDEWIELSRRQYNFRLGERFRWFDSTRTPVNACPNVQKDDLTHTKRLFPEYKEMPSQVLQNVIEPVTRAFDRFVKGDKNGKRSGQPKFKGKPYYSSICFPHCLESLPRDVNSGKPIEWIGLQTVGMDSASLKNAFNSAPTRAVTTKQEARVLSVLR
jgi:putative transposase